MFLGWYDPDRKRPVAEKLQDAIERYIEKYGTAPAICLISPADAQGVDRPDLILKPVEFIPRHTFYLGREVTA